MIKKEIKKDKVFQYTGKMIPANFKRPPFIIDAFKRKMLYFVEDILLIRNNWKYCNSYLKVTEKVNIGDYLLQDEEGIVYLVKKVEFENGYIIIE